MNADWDIDALKVVLEDIAGDFVKLMGFSQDELVELLAEPKDGLTQGGAVPDVPETAINIDGDIRVLGKHHAMCGESTRIDQI